MLITLITPPSCFLLDERVFMSLGILKVASSLEAEGYEVVHLDLSGVENYLDVVTDYIKDKETAVFGVTATTPQMPSTMAIVKLLRPKYKVIIGGPHVTLVNAAARKEIKENNQGRAVRSMDELLANFDTVVAGDGERSIFRAIKEYGLIDGDDTNSNLWQTSQNFTDSPFPARHLVNVDSYHYTVDGEKALSMVSQLGCPFECGFCGGRLSPMLRRMRLRSADSVISEMLSLYDNYDIKGIMFYDDELNVNKGLVSLMKKIKDTGIEWRLRGFVKAELFNEEQAEAMYAAGFRWLLCGFESAHPRILRNINKKAKLEDNTKMLRIAHKYGLKVKALMSFGHPGESEETITATKDWLLAEKPDDFDCTIITTYPGCPYYDHAKHLYGNLYCYEFAGDRLYSENVDYTKDAQYYKGKPGDYRSFVWTDYLTPKQLVSLRDYVETDVRTALSIPFQTANAAIRYEHSMGQSLPETILRKS